MMRKPAWYLVGLLIIGLALLAVSCSSTTPAEEEEEEVVGEEEEEEEEVTVTKASIVRGGLLYDKWWKIADGATEPTGDNPLWSLQSSNTRTGADTWRCKECHGWDYQGIDGAYASGSHMTGFTGVHEPGSTRMMAEMLEIMKGGNNANHDFSAVMGDGSLQDIANFLSEGLIDDTQYINYSTKGIIGADLDNGKQLYDGTCASCHGSDGWMIDFGDEGVGDLANGNPWETLHKIRFGHPGSAMPSSINSGWSTEDAVDVLGYAQTLEKATEEEEEPTTGGIPNIPAGHASAGCPVCHEEGIAGAPQWPTDHAGRTEATCSACHQATG